MRSLILKLLLLAVPVVAAAGSSSSGGGIAWRGWSDDLFAQAQSQQRFVILDLEAVWCHWCHVMEEKTYSDPAVIEMINKHYIPVRVDQDARPDLSRRYQEYGWPATIVFNARGEEIVKRAGYIEPQAMARLLQAIVDDPTPEASAATRAPAFVDNPLLSSELRTTLQQRHHDSYDPEYGGLKLGQKFLDRDSVEYAMFLAQRGDKDSARRARHTLDAAIALIDPVWGGVYQYSTGGKWDYPHFEKIMNAQASYMRIYALAYLQFREPRYLQAARDIQRYLRDFLTGPEGAFYTSQDADLVPGQHSREYFELDDADRRAQGIPRVDKNIYARENGWAIEGLAVLFAATGDDADLAQARRALDWVAKHRALPGGGYRHGVDDAGGPFLGDTLAMGRAALALYAVTGERALLTQAEQAAQFIDAKFRYGGAGEVGAGYAAAYAPPTAVIKPLPQIDENIALARFAMLLVHYTGDKGYRGIAERAMRYLAAPAVATSRLTEAGVLLADYELANDPTHITVVGHKDDANALRLFRTAITYPGGYKRIEWWDKREGAMPNPDVQYPSLKQAAAFACSNQRCSLPVFEPDQVHAMVDLLNGVADTL